MWPDGVLDRERDNAIYNCTSTSNLAGPGDSSKTVFRVECEYLAFAVPRPALCCKSSPSGYVLSGLLWSVFDLCLPLSSVLMQEFPDWLRSLKFGIRLQGGVLVFILLYSSIRCSNARVPRLLAFFQTSSWWSMGRYPFLVFCPIFYCKSVFSFSPSLCNLRGVIIVCVSGKATIKSEYIENEKSHCFLSLNLLEKNI